MPLRVAAAQAASVAGDLAANVATAGRLVSEAAEQGAALVVLPEAFLTGYDPAVFAGPLPVDGRWDWLDPLRDKAIETQLGVVAGIVLQRDGRRTLSSLVVGRDGTIEVPYDKQHLVGAEREHLSPGDHGASLVVDAVELGLAVCYDGCFPEHARAASDAGAIGYLCGAAYLRGSEHRRDLYYAARALDNGCYVVLAGLTGRCGSQEFSGGSAIYDPEGRPLARLGEQAGVVVADLDPAVVASTRAAHSMGHDRLASLGPRTRVRLR